MSSSNQRPAKRGFRSVFRCAISHYRQFPWLSAPEPRSAQCYRFCRFMPFGQAPLHQTLTEENHKTELTLFSKQFNLFDF